MGALGFGIARGRRRSALLAARPLPLLSGVGAEGWQAAAALPLAAVSQSVSIARQGFTAAAVPVGYSESVTPRRRVRQMYPNQAVDTPGNVALADYLYATDGIAGVPNTSTETSPKPVAAWVMPSRLLVGNSVRWELVAFHRDARAGRQVACVRVRGNDGTTQTAWQTVSTTAISTLAEDAQPIEVHGGDLDVSALATGLFWLEAEIYPWIGATASVLSSEDQSDPREFHRRYFTRNVALATTPPLVYVSPAGNDATGVCSTSPATASASPFATVHGAIAGAIAASGITGGKVDGVRVRIMAGTNAWGTFNAAINRGQSSAALIVERDPASPRGACILQQSSAQALKLGYATSSTSSLAASLAEGAIILRDLTYRRTAAGQITQGASAVGLDIQLWNVAFDNGGLAGAWSGSAGGLRLYGTSFTNLGTLFVYNGTAVQRLMRGVTATMATAGSEEWVKVGCRLTGWQAGTLRDATTGGIWYNNVYLSPSPTSAPISVQATTAGDTITGVVVVQNLIEVTHTTSSTPGLRLSSDNANGSIVHAVVQHNVVTGYGITGRQNLFYDESSGTNRRNHRLIRCTGNIFVQLNTKGDVFVALSQGNTAEAPNRTGQLAFGHGVGCQGNWSMFSAQAPASEAQTYAGAGSSIGGSTTVRNDPGFVSYQGTGGSGGTASVGSGGGDYRLQAGSAARGIVALAVLGFDLAGAPRSAGTQAAGAFA